jgi:hypothetical protein
MDEERERQYHAAILKLLDDNWRLEEEIQKLKGGETKDEKSNIIYFDPFWNGTFGTVHHAGRNK